MRLPHLRASLDLHLSIGKPDEPEDRYEDGVGSHHDSGKPPTGFNRLVRPEEQS